MTWAGIFYCLFALAVVATILYAVLEEAVVFSSAVSAATWMMLSFMPEIEVASGGQEVALQIGASRWLFAALAVLSTIALAGSIIGWYPPEEQEESREGMIQ